MNHFCNHCQHSKLPNSLKTKFNNNFKITFIDCPTSDKVVAGCFIKNLDIDWGKFAEWLIDNRNITLEEVSKLKELGLIKEKEEVGV